jgi:PAS domain S-box-containing protein
MNAPSHSSNEPTGSKTKITEDRFRYAFDNAPMGMAVVDFDLSLRRVNAALCEALGYTAEELLKQRLIDITHPDDLKRDLGLADRVLSGEIPSYRIEKRFLKKDGSLAWLEVTAMLIRGDEGEPLYGLAMVEDITARRRNAEALRASEERYRSFVVNSSEGIWRLDVEEPIDTKLPPDEQISLLYKHGYMAECNDAMARMHGYERADDIVGLRFGDSRFSSHPANTAVMRKLIARNYRLLDLQTEDLGAGGIRYFSSSLIGIVLNGMLLRIWGVQKDQTELRKTANQLEQSHRQLHALSGHLQALREREKAALAREIHDTVGQSLTSIKIELALLKGKIKKAELETVDTCLDEIIQSLDQTVQSVKTFATELRPAVLDKFGLSAAIDWQCTEFSRRLKIVCDCRLPMEELELAPELSTALFRILQEALTNVAQHSQAKAASVDLEVDDSRVVLSVRDDGIGITTEAIEAPSSLGLLGMSERIKFLGGSFSISGKSGQGTLVRVSVPFTTKVVSDDSGESDE